MNRLSGSVVRIESSNQMSMVDINVHGDVFSSIVLETPQTVNYLVMDHPVELIFKETEVSIAKNLSGQISLRNRFKATIESIESSPLLSKVNLNYNHQRIVAVISTRSALALNLQPGEGIEWLVKTNEISLWSSGK